MHWLWYTLIGYICSWISLLFLFLLKAILDFRPFSKKIEPIPKKYYFIHNQDYKGVYKFIKKDLEFYMFKFYEFMSDECPREDGLRPVRKQDIIRLATKQEMKEKLIDEL